MSVDTTVIAGWAEEATVEEDPIDTNSSDYWYFGVDAFPFDLPTTKQIWRPTYYGDRDPGTTTLVKSEVDPQIITWPVNGIPWYYAMGTSNNAGTDHIISGINSGLLPTLTYRWETKGGTVPRYYSCRGTRIETLGFRAQRFTPATLAIGMAGIKHATADLNAAHNGRSFPTSKSEKYFMDTATICKWNSTFAAGVYSSGGTELITSLFDFQYTLVNQLQKGHVHNQTEREYIHEGPRVHHVSLGFLRGVNRDIFDDLHSGTQRNLHFKIFNESDKFLQVDITNVSLQETKQNVLVQTETENFSDLFTGFADSVIITADDGVNDSFYS